MKIKPIYVNISLWVLKVMYMSVPNDLKLLVWDFGVHICFNFLFIVSVRVLLLLKHGRLKFERWEAALFSSIKTGLEQTNRTEGTALALYLPN